MIPATKTIAIARIFIQAFGKSPCSACGRRTTGKLADYVIGSCGGYYTNCVALCSRCYKRVVKTAAKAGCTTTDHLCGMGARLLEVITVAGIEWCLARTWRGDRQLERRLKNRKHASLLCPVCSGESALRRAKYSA